MRLSVPTAATVCDHDDVMNARIPALAVATITALLSAASIVAASPQPPPDDPPPWATSLPTIPAPPDAAGDPDQIQIVDSNPPPEQGGFGFWGEGGGCVDGTYDVYDNDLQRWMRTFLAVNGTAPDVVVDVEPGSGVALTFASSGAFTLVIVLDGSLSTPDDPSIPPSQIEMSGELTGTWAARAPYLGLVTEGSSLSGTVTTMGMSFDLSEMGTIPTEYPYVSAVFECYDGILLIKWPTGEDATTGEPLYAPIVHLHRR